MPNKPRLNQIDRISRSGSVNNDESMSSTQADIFSALARYHEDPAAMLAEMVDYFRAERRPVELFESLKMKVRNAVGLPLVATDSEPVRPEEIEQQLELGLLDACREAGTMLLEEGRVREGWMYLRPTGDVPLASRLLAAVEINEDNYDEMIQVLLHEGVDIGRGYQAVLDHQGTCNSITLYEQAIVNRSKLDRRAAASRLLTHLYDELRELVRADIAQREPPAAEDETLAELIESRRWVLEEGGYHLDTTHIAATVRIAAVLDNPGDNQKAWELTQYGRRLHHQFQYPGEEPFVDFYPAYAAFYSALLGRHVDAALRLFERKARTVDVAQHGTAAIETYIDLLDRVGRPAQAVAAAVELVPDEVPPQRTVPMLLEIAARAESHDGVNAFDAILTYCRKHEDVLGFAAVMQAKASAKRSN